MSQARYCSCSDSANVHGLDPTGCYGTVWPGKHRSYINSSCLRAAMAGYITQLSEGFGRPEGASALPLDVK